MKILHTADWHLGVRLHGYDLMPDHALFFDWLVDLIEKESVDCLLVSGDIFDMANPSNEARKQYFRFLTRIPRSCQVVITGGNHDSPAMLDAPSEILEALNISVIGGKPENLHDLIIPLKKEGKVEAVVAAVPFLRDIDLRKSVIGQVHEELQNAIREGIKNIFAQCGQLCEAHYPDVPAIAMGHLYAQGVKLSESERDIQIGNLAAFDGQSFSSAFSYYALGHIHRPQRVNAEGKQVYYSGSPIALSFSEKKDQKRVLLFDATNFEPVSIEIPKFRSLIRVSGTLETITEKLDTLPERDGNLTCLIEAHLSEESYSAMQVRGFENLLEAFDVEGYEIVHRTVSFVKKRQQDILLYEKGTNINELKPIDVFSKRMEGEPFTDAEKQEVTAAFLEILQEIEQEG